MKYVESKKIVFIILCFFILLGVTKAFAQEEQKVISLFEKEVAKFEKFFSSNPKLLLKSPFSNSPTGYVFYYQKFDDYKISYDVRKSDSLVSPYMGYITLSYLETSSKNCGDNQSYSNKYFTTIEAVRKIKEDESCYKPLIGTSVKFIFAFQKKQWVYKDVVWDNNEPNLLFYAAFGKPSASWHYVEDNDFWKKLIK